MKRIYAKEEYCIGCRLCEVHCLVQHSKSKKIIKAFKEELPRILPKVLVEESGPLSFALQCRHCEDAKCVESCMTGAMYKDKKTGTIQHNADKCVGCWMCIMICPFGVIGQDKRHKKIASKCDLCVGEELPACVANCPNEALVYMEKRC